MKMKKIISALLIAVFALGMFLPNASAQAAGEDPGSAVADDTGVVLSKRVDPGATADAYTLTLEAYVTGQKIVTEVTEDIPTDIVLVLDQSGSMDDNMYQYTFTPYNSSTSNRSHYENRHNGGNENLWYKLDDGSYASVSVVRESVTTGQSYVDISGKNNTNYYNYYSNNLYHKIDDTYHKVSVDWDYRNNKLVYTYSCATCGTTLAQSNDREGRPNLELYQLQNGTTEYKYTYSYTVNGVTTVIGTSTGANTAPREYTFYQRQRSGSITRLNALKNALTTFAEQVETKAKGADGEFGGGDDVNHRIAVVGFAYGSSGSYYNTELFIGSQTYTYGWSAEAQYGNVFQDMNTADGVDNINDSIGALDGYGSTCINLGMDMADDILEANPVNANEKRYRVVIVFTDGSPTTSNGFEDDVADEAIKISDNIKADGATVYAVGIFDGADATSEGNKDSSVLKDKCNWFMQNLSSNNGSPQDPTYYLSTGDADALSGIFHQISSSIESGGATSTLTETTVVQDIISDQFTLPAGADADNIEVFTADCINKVDNTFIFDDPQPFGVDDEEVVTIDGNMVSVTKFDYSENWVGTETAASGAVSYHGKKLIIKIPIVVRPDFLGGNDVATNGAASGIYIPDGKDDQGNDILKNVAYFNVPTVDIPLKEVTQPTADQHLYLGTAADIGGLVTQVGEFTVNGKLYQVDGINNGYVTLTYYITDNDGTELGTYTIDPGTKMADVDINAWVPASGVNMNPVLDNDVNTYKAYCTVTAPPSTDPDNPNNFKASSPVTANVYIYKPYVTYQDSAMDLGQTANYDDQDISNPVSNYVGVKWMNKNGTELVEATDAMGDAPSLTFTYAPVAGAFTQDTPVQVTAVTLSTAAGTMDALGYTTFYREACTFDGCTNTAKTQVSTTGSSWVNFVVHVRYAELTITKEVDGDIDQNQAFVFHVNGPGVDTYVVIYGEGSVTISGLVPGQSYYVTEQVDWSWRYYEKNSQLEQSKTLAAYPSTNEVTFVNARNRDNWLSGDNYAVNNFGDTTPDRGDVAKIGSNAGN